MSSKDNEMSFWDHLDDLRTTLVRSAIAVVLAFIVLFFFKSFIFDIIILAPTRPDFYLYRFLGIDCSFKLINVEVTAQFITHMKITFIAALILTVPYIIYQFWKFVAPALYENEKKSIRSAFAFSSTLFYLGAATGYFIVLPLMVYFFAGYKVSDLVENTFTLSSYISLFASSVLLFGLVYQFPTIIKVLSSLGIITRKTLTTYRKHAIVGVVFLAAIITPTGDPFTLFVVSVPLYLLYEFSVLITKKE